MAVEEIKRGVAIWSSYLFARNLTTTWQHPVLLLHPLDSKTVAPYICNWMTFLYIQERNYWRCFPNRWWHTGKTQRNIGNSCENRTRQFRQGPWNNQQRALPKNQRNHQGSCRRHWRRIRKGCGCYLRIPRQDIKVRWRPSRRVEADRDIFQYCWPR